MFEPLLDHSDAAVRAMGLHGLSRYGDEAASSVDRVIPLYADDDDDEVVWRAALAIATNDPAAPDTVQSLTRRLEK